MRLVIRSLLRRGTVLLREEFSRRPWTLKICNQIANDRHQIGASWSAESAGTQGPLDEAIGIYFNLSSRLSKYSELGTRAAYAESSEIFFHRFAKRGRGDVRTSACYASLLGSGKANASQGAQGEPASGAGTAERSRYLPVRRAPWPRSRIRRERIRSPAGRPEGARQGWRATAQPMPADPRPQP